MGEGLTLPGAEAVWKAVLLAPTDGSPEPDIRATQGSTGALTGVLGSSLIMYPQGMGTD